MEELIKEIKRKRKIGERTASKTSKRLEEH
jgi:hypothetical protein